MALFQWNPDVPHVSFTGLGKDAAKGDFRIEFTVTNPSPAPREIQHRISVVSDAAPRSLDSTLTVPPGKTVPIVLEFSEKTNVIRTLSAAFKDMKTGKTLYERTFIYDPALKTRWINPNQKRSAELEIGVYPYYKKVRARFGNPVEQVSGWQRGIFRIQSKDGKPVAERNGVKTSYGFETEFPFEPQAGEYILSAELTDANGKKVTKSRSFLIEKFPWEHNSIGCDRVIIPPFKAITCPTERSAEATLTGYRFRDGFFDRVTASDTENILAAPIRLTINGETVKETSFRFTEQSPDRIGTESGLRWSGGTVQVRGVMDYDGFYRFTMKFRPDGMQKINSAVLTVPLKKEYAKLIHSLCNRMKYNDAKFLPEKDGVIWRSSQSAKTPQLSGSFRPYVWIGRLGKGIAWMSESDRGWSLNPDGDALEVVSLPDRTELRIHLVNLPTEWEKEFTLEQAFRRRPSSRAGVPQKTAGTAPRFRTAGISALSRVLRAGFVGIDLFLPARQGLLLRKLSGGKEVHAGIGETDRLRLRETSRRRIQRSAEKLPEKTPGTRDSVCEAGEIQGALPEFPLLASGLAGIQDLYG